MSVFEQFNVGERVEFVADFLTLGIGSPRSVIASAGTKATIVKIEHSLWIKIDNVSGIRCIEIEEISIIKPATMTTPPTIADVWAAFQALSAAWDEKRGNAPLVHIRIYTDGSGSIEGFPRTQPSIVFSTLADALTAIAAARAGLEG